MRNLKCGECGAQLNIQDDHRDFVYCEYCGAKIDLYDQRILKKTVIETRDITNEKRIEAEYRVQRIKVTKFNFVNLVLAVIAIVGVIGVVITMMQLDLEDPFALIKLTMFVAITAIASVLLAKLNGVDDDDDWEPF